MSIPLPTGGEDRDAVHSGGSGRRRGWNVVISPRSHVVKDARAVERPRPPPVPQTRVGHSLNSQSASVETQGGSVLTHCDKIDNIWFSRMRAQRRSTVLCWAQGSCLGRARSSLWPFVDGFQVLCTVDRRQHSHFGGALQIQRCTFDGYPV